MCRGVCVNIHVQDFGKHPYGHISSKWHATRFQVSTYQIRGPTLAPKYSYRKRVKAKVYELGVRGISK